jgi:hypothetical protein
MVDERCAVLIPPRDVGALINALEMALDRNWEESVIANHFHRSWEDMAYDIYDFCISVLSERAVSERGSAPRI